VRFLLSERLRVLCNLGKTWGRSLDALAVSNTGSVPAGCLLSHNAGLLAEQIQVPTHARQPRSDRPREPGPDVESDADSSDDDEGLELEPAPVLADVDIIAASDLVHQWQHSDDGVSDTSGSSDGDSIAL
jgi:hypothetical protein